MYNEIWTRNISFGSLRLTELQNVQRLFLKVI